MSAVQLTSFTLAPADCSVCRYCDETCSHADWPVKGHRLVCRTLGAERSAAKAAAAAARRREGGAASGSGSGGGSTP